MLGELLLDADWSVPVPTCPGWTLLQLVRHVGRADRWAAQIIADRADASLDPRLVREGRPPADVPGAVRWLSESPRTLLAALEAVGPDTEVSTFLLGRPPWRPVEDTGISLRGDTALCRSYGPASPWSPARARRAALMSSRP